MSKETKVSSVQSLPVLYCERPEMSYKKKKP